MADDVIRLEKPLEDAMRLKVRLFLIISFLPSFLPPPSILPDKLILDT